MNVVFDYDSLPYVIVILMSMLCLFQYFCTTTIVTKYYLNFNKKISLSLFLKFCKNYQNIFFLYLKYSIHLITLRLLSSKIDTFLTNFTKNSLKY